MIADLILLPLVMKKTVVGIFEDEIVNRYIYERLLRFRDDLEVHIFDTIEKGIELMKTTAFDVVFIEAHFRSNFGGIDILNLARSAACNSPSYIAITSLLQRGDLERLLTAGFLMCLEKPIVFSDVIGSAKPEG